LLYTIKEVAKGIIIKGEDKNNIITNLGILLDKRFNLNKGGEFDFNDAIDSDEDIADKNI
jgi:hypothetical protein